MAKRLKTVYAGAIIERALYDRISGREPPRERAAKAKASSEAQKRMNLKNACHQFELRIALNFPTAGSARFYTLTYDDAHLPRMKDPKAERARVLRDKDALLRAIREERRKAGKPEPRAAWCIEVLTSEAGRWHLHMLLDNTGSDFANISFDLTPLFNVQESPEGIEVWKKCMDISDLIEHVWGFTRSCWKVEVDSRIVPDDYELEPILGGEILADRQEHTEFASWRFQKIRVGAAAFPPRARARRRRRKR